MLTRENRIVRCDADAVIAVASYTNCGCGGRRTDRSTAGARLRALEEGRDGGAILFGQRGCVGMHRAMRALAAGVFLQCVDQVLGVLTTELRNRVSWVGVLIVLDAMTSMARIGENFALFRGVGIVRMSRRESRNAQRQDQIGQTQLHTITPNKLDRPGTVKKGRNGSGKGVRVTFRVYGFLIGIGGFMRTMSILTLLLAAAVSSTALGQAAPRTVSVTGAAEVFSEPDRATLTLGVESRKPTLEPARTEVAKGIDALLKLAKELKIDPKDVRTTRVTVQPEYDWNSTTRQRKLTGYYVLRQAEIVLRDLDQLGVLLERAVTAGANQVGEPMLESSKRRDLERQAMALAIDDAKLNAESVARAAKASLGPVRTIDSSVSYTPIPFASQPMVMSARAMSGDAERAQTYQKGQLTFSASVRVQYDLIVDR